MIKKKTIAAALLGLTLTAPLVAPAPAFAAEPAAVTNNLQNDAVVIKSLDETCKVCTALVKTLGDMPHHIHDQKLLTEDREAIEGLRIKLHSIKPVLRDDTDKAAYDKAQKTLAAALDKAAKATKSDKDLKRYHLASMQKIGDTLRLIEPLYDHYNIK